MELHENHARPTEAFNGVALAKISLDTTALVSTYVGKIKLVKIKHDQFDENTITDFP